VVAVAWLHEPPVQDLRQRSDVREVTSRLGRLAPGDLVLSAAPETVPVLRYYLGPRPRYASAIGPAPDPGVMDWRDAYRRLRREPPGAIAALAGRVPRGGEIVLVRPRRSHASATPWATLYRQRGAQLESLLRHDPRLLRIRRLAPAFRGTKTTIRADVFRVRRGTAGRRG
jgi:hypothetical protein